MPADLVLALDVVALDSLISSLLRHEYERNIEIATIAVAAACAPHSKGSPKRVLEALIEAYKKWLGKDRSRRRGDVKGLEELGQALARMGNK